MRLVLNLTRSRPIFLESVYKPLLLQLPCFGCYGVRLRKTAFHRSAATPYAILLALLVSAQSRKASLQRVYKHFLSVYNRLDVIEKDIKSVVRIHNLDEEMTAVYERLKRVEAVTGVVQS